MKKRFNVAQAVLPAIISAVSYTAFVNQTYAAEGALEEVIVTGTRKEGLSPEDTMSPIDVLGGASINKQASFNMTDSLTKISPALNTQRFPIADGTAFVRPVTLRNLSPDHTLVLVNGTRRHRSALVNLQLAPLGTVNQGSQGVDFSAFPSLAIKRVEVLRDGASAQYGSDAIAGVVNLILDDANEGIEVSAQYGVYNRNDGDRYTVAAKAGFAVGENGFTTVTVERSRSDITSRGTARPDAAGIADIVGADLVPYDGYGQRWGDPDVKADKLFVNFGLPVSETAEIYGNFSYMENETLSGFFYRGPVMPTAQGNIDFPARTTLQIDANGDGLPDAASFSQVAALTVAGYDPADFLTASNTAASGYVLLNPIYTQFPGGYSPLFGANIDDYGLVFGGRGDMTDTLSYDIRFRNAKNQVEYVLEDSINPSLGIYSPTTFNPGTLIQEEQSLNADFVKTLGDWNLAFGIEWREETYEIRAGDPASTYVGPTYAIFGVGSDGFQGFPDESAGSFVSESNAVYVDLEGDVTEQLSMGFALRHEDFDLFGTTTDWKVSARFDVNDTFAIRGTANTGFRAPTPGQVNTLNVTTTSDSTGALIPSGTYPVSHPVAVALGAEPLTPEESTSFSVGFVWTPTEMTTVTLDYYDITIEDRIALQSFTVSADDVATLTAAGVADADLLLNSNGNFFVNGFESNVSGIDLNVATEMDLMGGSLGIDFRHNYNQQDVSNVKAGTIGIDRVYDLENQVPENSSVLSFNYAKENYNSTLRFNYYGDWSSTGGLFGPGDASDAYTYSGKVLVDVEASITLMDSFTLTVGGDNIFDTYPEKEANGVLGFLGQQYSVTSPFGFNGAFWYMRASASF